MQLNSTEGLKELDKVVLKHGVVNGKSFSFKDHEFQIEIIRDTRSRQCVRKCSQVGLSELMVQKTLALALTMPHKRAIFTLPTRDFAMSFSKDRMDSAIDNSPTYSGMVQKANNSASQKKIGSFMLYITGSFGANSAISIPAEILINDEVDFSNDAVLGKLSSRLRHAEMVDEKGNRGMRMKFSTPTVNGYGVDKDFEAGHQAYYMVKCTHCQKWVVPDFFHDFVIPGYDEEVVKLRGIDLQDPKYDFDAAKILCSECRGDLWKALCSPDRRQWVAKRPDVWEHSYQVYPWDAPKYNPPSVIIRQLGDYPLISDFYNFVIGLPHSDSENTFNTEQSYRARISIVDMWPFPGYLPEQGLMVAGMDVGKVCHFVVCMVVGRELRVVFMRKVQNTRDNPASAEVGEYIKHFRVTKMCIDAGPDITLVNQLVGEHNEVSAVVYVRNITGLLPYEEKGDGSIINADRTKTLSELLAKHNSGEIKYPSREDYRDEVFKHLATTKKIRERDASGDITERFVKTSPQDHWVHSLNYAQIAALSLGHSNSKAVVGVLPGVTTVRVGKNAGKSGT